MEFFLLQKKLLDLAKLPFFGPNNITDEDDIVRRGMDGTLGLKKWCLTHFFTIVDVSHQLVLTGELGDHLLTKLGARERGGGGDEMDELGLALGGEQ